VQFYFLVFVDYDFLGVGAIAHGEIFDERVLRRLLGTLPVVLRIPRGGIDKLAPDVREKYPLRLTRRWRRRTKDGRASVYCARVCLSRS
jgi:hypothetical protein